jgi:hypothetical protein
MTFRNSTSSPSASTQENRTMEEFETLAKRRLPDQSPRNAAIDIAQPDPLVIVAKPW